MYTNKSRKELVYYNKNLKRVIENNLQSMAKFIAQNMKRCYLNASNFLKQIKGSPDRPKTYESDLIAINHRIHELGNIDYQMELLRNINIPIENDIN